MCAEGERHGGYWRERYREGGGYGARRYCEYPASLIRIVHRFLFGIRCGLNGELTVAPCMPDEWLRERPEIRIFHRGRMRIVRVTPRDVEIDGVLR